MPKLLCIGDMHIDKLSNTIPNFTTKVLKSFNYVVEKGIEDGATCIVIAGDIFDSSNPSQRSIVQFMKAIQDSPIPVYVMLGNHDYSDSTSHSLVIAKWFEKDHSKNLKIVTEPTPLKVGKMKYLLYPHPYVEDLPSGYDYGIAHFAVNGARGDNGFVVRTKNQPKGRFILGDFHTPQSGKTKKCSFEYIGSLTQLAWAEDTKKRAILIDEDGDKNNIKVKHFYELRTLIVESKDDLDKVGNEKGVFYRLKTKGFELPPSFLANNPNVLKHSPISIPKNKKAQVLLEDSEYTLDPLSKLRAFLESKKYSDKVVNKAVKIADKLRGTNA
jgi:DNA repair exonuclease SbcCD nuclease subunit